MAKNDYTYDQLFEIKRISILHGFEELGFDPRYRHWVKAIAVDLAREFPNKTFDAVPGEVGHWPKIFVEEK